MFCCRYIIVYTLHKGTNKPNNNNNNNNNNNEKLKEKFGNYTRKTCDLFTTKDSYTWNITHNKGKYCNLKLET